MGVGVHDPSPASRPVEDYRELYRQVCESYRAIDDFRMKLLGLLPVATGAGVLALLSSGRIEVDASGETLERMRYVSAGVALFGVAITLGLFAYELHGIKKCGRLIMIGARMEEDMGASGPFYGQFTTRPHRVARLIDVPFASCVVYPAAVAVWVFVGLVLINGRTALIASAGTLVGMTTLSVLACRRLDTNLKAWDEGQKADQPAAEHPPDADRPVPEGVFERAGR